MACSFLEKRNFLIMFILPCFFFLLTISLDFCLKICYTSLTFQALLARASKGAAPSGAIDLKWPSIKTLSDKSILRIDR
jgi:hypothetical protein